MNTAVDISQVTDAARAAARVLANVTTQAKNHGLEAIAAALIERSEQILAANALFFVLFGLPPEASAALTVVIMASYMAGGVKGAAGPPRADTRAYPGYR